MGWKEVLKGIASQVGLVAEKPRPGETEEEFKRRQDDENSTTAATTGAVL